MYTVKIFELELIVGNGHRVDIPVSLNDECKHTSLAKIILLLFSIMY